MALDRIKPGSNAFEQRLANLTPKQLEKGSFDIAVNIGVPIGKGFENPTGKFHKFDANYVLEGSIGPATNMQWVKASYRFEVNSGTWVINTMFPTPGG